MSSSAKVTRFRVQNVARQAGELARFRVAKGPDRGSIFVLRDSRVTIGRGEDSDIMIGDLKASRFHAEGTGPCLSQRPILQRAFSIIIHVIL